MSDFAPLDAEIEDLTRAIAPAGRKALSARIATDLRKANAQRIRANVDPDGDPMAPRKAKARGGRLRGRKSLRDRMFKGAAGTRYLRKQATSGEAQVGFAGAMARIMRVHQLGLRDTVTRDPSSPEVTYPTRRVLGIANVDQARILETVADHLQP